MQTHLSSLDHRHHHHILSHDDAVKVELFHFILRYVLLSTRMQNAKLVFSFLREMCEKMQMHLKLLGVAQSCAHANDASESS